MKKIVIHSAGGYEKLKIEDFPMPKPQAEEVLVHVQAAGVNYADCCVRWGVYESAKKYVGWPITPGFEFSGVVTESKSSRFKAGDEVFGVTRFGAYASDIVVPEHQLFFKPKVFSLSEAAAFPAVFLTAYHAIFHHVVLRPNSHVLIHSAAGGVGSALVQLANVKKYKITAVVGSSHKVEYVKTLGANNVIDKSHEDLWGQAEKASPDGFDAVFDANGAETFLEGYRHLKSMGKLIVYGSHTLLPKQGGRINYLKAAWGLLKTPKFNPMNLVTENKSVIGFNLSFLFDQTELFVSGMNQLIDWAEQGLIKAPKVTEVPFERVAEAHQMIESGQSIGKIVLTFND